MPRSSRVIASVVLAASATVLAATAQAQFYKGRTITMVINYGAGGNTDIEGRIFARHLPRHIPGEPAIIVTNRPGAGGLIGLNHLGSGAAAADGMTMGFLTFGPVTTIVKDPALKVNVADFAFIGGLSQQQVAYGRKDIKPGLNRPADIVKATEVFGAGSSPASPRDVALKLTLGLMGVKHKIVTGFRSSNDINLAILRNEAHFTSSSQPGYQSQAIPQLIEPGIAMPFWYYQMSAPGGGLMKYQPLEAQGVRGFAEVYREAHGKMPSGPAWEAFLVLNDIASAMLRSVAMPPGTPKEPVEVLRKAFTALATDEQFRSEYQGLVKMRPEFVAAEDGMRILAKLDKIDPAAVAVIKEAVGTK
jgi:tripartite-type tricarboxylate transporter receptor subunit TctC